MPGLAAALSSTLNDVTNRITSAVAPFIAATSHNTYPDNISGGKQEQVRRQFCDRVDYKSAIC